MIREVLEEHYLGALPPLRHPDKLLVFEKERAFMLFTEGGVRLFLRAHPPSFDYLMLFCKSKGKMGVLDKMNLNRVVKLLCRRCDSIFVEYSDPDFVGVIDAALRLTPPGGSPQDPH